MWLEIPKIFYEKGQKNLSQKGLIIRGRDNTIIKDSKRITNISVI